MPRFAVIDFETTGMSPLYGDRPTEVAVVLVEQGEVVDQFQSLMNPGRAIPSFISQMTGITNAMVAAAPPVETVMADAAAFVGDTPMVAHNASFDSKFWQAELHRIGHRAAHPFACTVLLSRRVFPEAPSHKLSLLAAHLGLPRNGRAHRALSDAMVTAELLKKLCQVLNVQHGINEVSHELLRGLQRCGRGAVAAWLRRQAQGTTADQDRGDVAPLALTPGSTNPQTLERLLTVSMPFGKYKGRAIADLPGHYLNWFAREGFPNGELGSLMALMQTIDHNGLGSLLEPLRRARLG